jgi:hypothetical protein
MPVLEKTGLTGRAVWLGLVADRPTKLSADPVDRLEARFEGLSGEYHSGLTRKSCTRVRTQYPVGTEIRNTRQITILSAEELSATATTMGLDQLLPEWVGANIVLSGIPDFTLIPPSTRLIFPSGASLVVDMENAPCQWPAKEIEGHHPGLGKGYKAAAKGRRGVTAWVEREGDIHLHEACEVHLPPQRIWPHA